MTTRRDFLCATASLPVMLSTVGSPAWAAAEGRFALVVGNDAYKEVPLANARNDASAVAGLLKRARFEVDLQLDTTRAGLARAIERFGLTLTRAEARLGLFYYAGHGVQVDWRNYLVPVDATVATAASLLTECIDLGALLALLDQAKGRNFVIILDACRENPFGKAYRPPHTGLSQFDAPLGSLLAFATAPGKLAADGGDKHSVYTEHLLKELAVPGQRLEAALKRVRLNVRFATQGAQIPWESTSLEDDIVLFPQPEPAESEQRQLAQKDLERWNEVKQSARAEDVASYLKEFPQGSFTEIAEVRLEQTIARPAESRHPATTPELPAAVSNNPYSQGRFPLARVFSVGDEASYVLADALSGVQHGSQRRRVTKVDERVDRIEINDGELVWDPMGNPVKVRDAVFDIPTQYYPAHLQLGKKWLARYVRREPQRTYHGSYRFHIAAREWVQVKSGSFHAFRIEGVGSNDAGSQFVERLWIVPSLNFAVKNEAFTYRGGRIVRAERRELVSYTQKQFGNPV